MRLADWLVLGGTLAAIVLYGMWRGRGANSVDKYLLAGKTLPWYTMALSIMATQASAVTFISTTGQSFVDGMRFVQFYFGLPLAMIVIAHAVAPRFHTARVYTAYEYLEQRFDARTRLAVSLIFLLQRGLALGITLYAPAVVLTVLLGWPDSVTTVVMGGVAVLYAASGGVKAVAWTNVQQMGVMLLGLTAALVSAVLLLPAHVSFGDAVTLAGAAGRLNAVTLNFDWNDRYNLWSGLIGGMFLALAYFGTDQSQVQRYLTGRSVAQSRLSLLFNGIAKVPMQFFILFIGAIVFVFYIYVKPPLLFEPREMAKLQAPEHAGVRAKFDAAFERRKDAADRLLAAGGESERRALGEAQREVDKARGEAAAALAVAGGKRVNDTNYIFLTFVTTYLPAGLVGLVLAVILGATMSAISAEMSSLASVSVIDIYKRWMKGGGDDGHYLLASRAATLVWGVYAVASAQYAKGLGSLIEAVNLLGSLFYGGMLGVFVLAFYFPKVCGRGAFYGVLAGEAVIFACFKFTAIAFLWYNVIGCVVVVATGMAVSSWRNGRPEAAVPAG